MEEVIHQILTNLVGLLQCNLLCQATGFQPVKARDSFQILRIPSHNSKDDVSELKQSFKISEMKQPGSPLPRGKMRLLLQIFPLLLVIAFSCCSLRGRPAKLLLINIFLWTPQLTLGISSAPSCFYLLSLTLKKARWCFLGCCHNQLLLFFSISNLRTAIQSLILESR